MKPSALIALFCAASVLAQSEDKSTWGRALIDEPAPGAPASRVRYALVFLDSTVGHLVGEFEVNNTTSRPEQIDGTQTSDGKFWATVEAQMTSGATPREWQWRTIGRPATPGQPSKFVIEPVKSVSTRKVRSIFVDMDIFKPFIGKATFGRIFLPNGHWSMFELNDLLPPKT